MNNLHCERCSKTFKPKGPGAKYCSSECRDESRRIRERERYRKDNEAGRSRYYRDKVLKQRYGIDQAYYDGLFHQQQGVCKICGEPQEPDLYVDHHHESGRVRGLLCKRCNWGLGNFRDDPWLLESAAQYLRST